MKPTHHLVRTIGLQAAKRLCRKYTRERVMITSNRIYLRWFDSRVYALQGPSLPEISRAMQPTRNHVQELLAGFKAEEYEPLEATPAARRCPGCGRPVRAERAGLSAAPAPMPLLDFAKINR